MKVYGNGSVQQHDRSKKPNRCRVWRIFVKTEDGMKTEVFHGSKRDANARRDEFVEELRARVLYSDSFKSYAKDWLEYRTKCGDYSPNTLKKDGSNIKQLVTVISGDLESITPESIRKALLELRETRSGTTVRCLYNTLRAILNQAVEDGRMSDNPCLKVKPPKKDTKEKKALTTDQLSAILDSLDRMEVDGRVMAMYFMICLGLRRGEAVAIYWEDIDGNWVHIRRAYKEATGKIAEPKSEAGVRSLPMPERLQAKLAEWNMRYEELLYNGKTVCCGTHGRQLHPQNLEKWIDRNREDIGMVGVTMHQLRHSNLTMVAYGMSPFALMQWAGWSDIAQAKTYIHSSRDELLSTAARVVL